MAEIAFYHMTRSTADKALPALLAKTLEAGHKALVCADKDSWLRLSAAIWSHEGRATASVASVGRAQEHGGGNDREGGSTSWLAHGISGRDDDDAALCPIWITDSVADNPIDAGFVFFAGSVAPEIPDGAARVFILFDGRDDEAVGRARGYWKDYKDGAHALRYLKQDESGKWQEQKS